MPSHRRGPLPVTARQRDALRAIVTYIDAHQRPPTIRELAVALGVTSPNAVNALLDALERKGVLTRTLGSSRNIKLLGQRPPPAYYDLTPSSAPITVRCGAVSVRLGPDGVGIAREGRDDEEEMSWAVFETLLFSVDPERPPILAL